MSELQMSLKSLNLEPFDTCAARGGFVYSQEETQ
jgi:hypothetical protein